MKPLYLGKKGFFFIKIEIFHPQNPGKNVPHPGKKYPDPK